MDAEMITVLSVGVPTFLAVAANFYREGRKNGTIATKVEALGEGVAELKGDNSKDHKELREKIEAAAKDWRTTCDDRVARIHDRIDGLL